MAVTSPILEVARPVSLPSRRRFRPLLGFLTVFVLLLIVWEVAKIIGGDPWRYDSFLWTGVPLDYHPPLTLGFATDSKLPHTWDIAMEFFSPDAAGATTFERLFGAALFTLRNAAIGFALGSAFGLGLAIVLIHVRILERALVPLIVASQTIPIIAIAPLIVIGLKADWFGVAIVSTYLTFFPVTIAALRGLRAYDPRALELMRSLRGVARRDPAQTAPPGRPAVPVHGVPDRGPGGGRRRDRRRAALAHPGRPGAPDHHRHAVLLVERGIPVGHDRDVVAAGDRRLPAGRGGRRVRPSP